MSLDSTTDDVDEEIRGSNIPKIEKWTWWYTEKRIEMKGLDLCVLP